MCSLLQCDLYYFRRKIAIEDTIIQKGRVKFADVVGLVDAKQALKEAIIMPLQFPHLFTGKLPLFSDCLQSYLLDILVPIFCIGAYTSVIKRGGGGEDLSKCTLC